MGNQPSATSGERRRLQGKKVGDKKYKVPDVRRQDRFEPLSSSTYSNLYEASVDKVNNY